MLRLKFIAAGAMLLLSISISHAAGDPKRGRELHSANCISCHAAMYGGDGTGIYVRSDRKMASLEALRQQVGRCKDALGVEWPADQVEDVISYLNRTFYKFE